LKSRRRQTVTAKRTHEMTFREFVETEKATNNPLVNGVEKDVLEKMRQEGFTEAEIYGMTMPRLWNLYLEVVGNYLDQVFSDIVPVIKENPDLINNPTFKKVQKQLSELLKKLENQDRSGFR
ncbi:MAG TPA: hypothetical protein VK253_06050, partial [Candidatus Binatia bacterium]|nr:hypothetical protein [Candidatus Binatia bacterium]